MSGHSSSADNALFETAIVGEVSIRMYATPITELFGKTVRVLTRNPKVSAAFYNIPAWSATNGRKVYFNNNLLSAKYTDRALVGMTFLSYHEAAHIMFSPDPMKVAEQMNNQEQWAFNILEDQRIENMFIKVYPSTAKYFLIGFADLIASQGDPMVYVLAGGRKFLPAKYRDDARKLFGVRADKLDAIVGEYITLRWSKNNSRMVQLARDLARLLAGELPQQQCYTGSTPTGETDDIPFIQDEKITTIPENEAMADEQEEVQPVDVDPKSMKNRRGLKNIARDMANDVMKSEGMKEDVKGIKNSIRKIRQDVGFGSISGPNKFRENPTDVNMTQAANTMSRVLTKLRQDVEPGWVRGTADGRLDPVRAHRALNNRENFDTAYDRWDEGQEDEVDIEAVILLDVSSSMNISNRINAASEAMWVVKRGIESGGGRSRVSVITFADNAQTAYNRNQRVKRNTYRKFNAYGDTYPRTALEAAKEIILESKFGIKQLWVITDGTWCRCYVPLTGHGGTCMADRSHMHIETINKYATTVMVHIGDGKEEPDSHKCQIVEKFDSPRSIPILAARVVKETTINRIREVKR